MDNETIEVKVRRFFKFAGVDQLIDKESVGNDRALEILRGIDRSSILGDSTAMYGWQIHEQRYVNIISNLDVLYDNLISNLERLIDHNIYYLGPIGVHKFCGTYKQLMNKEGILTHQLFLENNLIDVILARTIGYRDDKMFQEILAMLPPKQVVYPATYHIRWQTKYEIELENQS